MGSTNVLTSTIIQALFSIGIFAYRQNVLPIPVVVQGSLVGYRPPPTAGLPDIQIIVPRGRSSLWPSGSGYLGCEVKNRLTHDRLRPSQQSFHANARAGGDARILVVSSYQNFLEQILPLLDLLTPDQIIKLQSYGPKSTTDSLQSA